MPKKRRQDRDGLYQRPNSSYWWASFTDASGRRTRRSTGTADRKEAEALLARWKLEKHREKQWDEPPTRTFDELMLPYLEYALAEKRQNPSGIKSAAKQLYKDFSGTDMDQISQTTISSYAERRRISGAAASTINKEIGLLSSAISHANRVWGWRLSNPTHGCRLREPQGRVRWLSPEDFERLLEAAQQEPRSPHLAELLVLAVNTGMRRGEMLKLQWSRVDRMHQLIYLEPEHTKTQRRRSVPLNNRAAAAIESRYRCAKQLMAQGKAMPTHVFCRGDGQPIGDVKHSFASACKRAGINDFRFHDLRHTCAAWLVQAGAPLAEVRDLLGHSTIKMTERYAHLAPEGGRSAVKLLERSSHSGHTDPEQARPKLALIQ